jgi:hypothetical protein
LQRLQLLVVQLLHPIASSFDVCQLHLLRGNVVLLAFDGSFLHLHLHFEHGGIDLGQQLAGRDHRVEVRIDGGDGAGHLRPHVDAPQGFDRASRLNGFGDGAARNGAFDDLRIGRHFGGAEVVPAGDPGGQTHNCRQQFLHMAFKS